MVIYCWFKTIPAFSGLKPQALIISQLLGSEGQKQLTCMPLAQISLKAGITVSSEAALSPGGWPVRSISKLPQVFAGRIRFPMGHGTEGLGSSLPVDWTPPQLLVSGSSPQSSSQHGNQFPSEYKVRDRENERSHRGFVL